MIFHFFAGCVIPQRYILGVMGLLGVCNAYTMRVCLNLAITQMVIHVEKNTTGLGANYTAPDTCPNELVTNATKIVTKPVSIYLAKNTFFLYCFLCKSFINKLTQKN